MEDLFKKGRFEWVERKLLAVFWYQKLTQKGKITYCNQAFIDISGFTEQELLGKPHNIVRHADMPRSIFAYLWKKIQNREEVNVYVKNLSKDGSYYWVFANVTPSFDMNDNIIGYYSVRRKPNAKGIKIATELYAKIKEAEKNGGIESGLALFHKHFQELGESYEDFILHTQVEQ